jgi:hypothetical protein
VRKAGAAACAALGVALSAAHPVAQSAGAGATCQATFAGFDTRLTAELLAHLPNDAVPIGFEITPSGPVVATATRLYAIQPDQAVSFPAPSALSSISIDSKGRLALQSGASVGFVGPRGMEPVAPWAGVIKGRVVNSGQPTSVEAVSVNGTTRFGVRSYATDAVLPIVEMDGDLRAASWTAHGLVAVAGTALIRWNHDRQALERLANDTGLARATDTCAIDADRAVVTQPGLTLLFTGKTATVIAAVGGLCRVSGDDLYVADPRLRRVWKLAGVSALGGRDRDLEHARRLVVLSVAAAQPFEETREFAEAVRLIGCREATRLAAETRR